MSGRCPYCKKKVEINHDDGYGYAEDKTHQQECSECEKTFTYETSITFLYETAKAECLNGGEHNYKETRTYPKRYTRLYCTMCDDHQPLPAGHPFLLLEE